jgi:hypothetical protein
VHAERSLARPGGGSFLRTGALLLAMTFALLSGLVFSTQTSAHALPVVGAVAGRVAPVIGWEVADTVAGLFMDQAVGDVDYFHGGNGGTGTGGPGDGASQSPAGKASRLGRLAELAATVFGMSAFEIGWSLAEGTDAGYADGSPVEATGLFYGSQFTFEAAEWQVLGPITSGSTTYGGTQSCSESVWCVNLDWVSGATEICCSGESFNWQLRSGGVAGSKIQAREGIVRCDFFAASDCSAGGLDGARVVSSTISSGTETCDPTTKCSEWVTLAEQPAPTAGETNPALTTSTTTTCSGGGSTATVTRYQPADDTLPHFTGSCPSGETVTGISQTTTRDSDGETVPSPLGPATAPIVPDAYPDCQPLGSCTLTLLRMAPDGALLANCQGTGACVGWQTQASPSTGTRTRTVTQTDGAVVTEPAWTYRDLTWLDCRYGSYTVPISDCTVVPTEPLAEPSVEASNCDAGDFSFNPISWVVVPLKCLFIPRDAAVQSAATAITTAWDGTAPAVVFDAIEQVGAPVVALKDDAGQQDCSGPPFTFPEVGVLPGFTIHPLSTCNELTQYLLGIYMPIATALVYLGGFFAGTRLLLKTVNVESPVSNA